MFTAYFTEWHNKNTESLLLIENFNQIIIESIIRGTDPSFTCHYKIICAPDWRFREMQVHTHDDQILFLRRDEAGHWFDNQNNELKYLSAAHEVDFVLTPFTNTLAIKRLKLQPGKAADIVTAWIDFPSLVVKLDPQRYTCLAPNLYRYESLDSDFKADITFDDNGIVTDYPGLFRRTA